MQVAYVLGQLQDKAASAELSNILRKTDEHPMVRHEAAEALGSIAGLICFHDFLVWFLIIGTGKEVFDLVLPNSLAGNEVLRGSSSWEEPYFARNGFLIMSLVCFCRMS